MQYRVHSSLIGCNIGCTPVLVDAIGSGTTVLLDAIWGGTPVLVDAIGGGTTVLLDAIQGALQSDWMQ